MRIAFFILLTSAALAGCASKDTTETAPLVRVFQVGSVAPLDNGASLTGVISAQVEPVLSFREGGRVTTRLVNDGETVRAGQLLARLDAADLIETSAAATAQASAARAAVDGARAAAVRAASDKQRLQGLSEAGAISARDYDTAVEGARATAARLTAAEGEVSAATANARLQANRRGYAELRAPSDGVITAVLAEAGQVVAAGTPVFRLAAAGARDLVVEVPEPQQGSLPRNVSAALYAGGRVDVVLRELSAAADPTTRTYRARYRVAGASPPLGSTATVNLPMLAGAASAIPIGAVTERGRGSGVWIVGSARKTVWRAVRIVSSNGEQAFVAGLRPGERIVALGAHLLQPGQAVRPLNKLSARAAR